MVRGSAPNPASLNSLSLPFCKKSALKTIQSFLLTCLLCMCGGSVFSQAVDVEIEVDTVHSTIYDEGLTQVDLIGFTTYSVYVICTNETDEISAVYGVAGGQNFEIDVNNCLFQHEFGGFVADDINPLFFPTFPSVEYDSFVTIGKNNSADPGDVFQALALPAPPTQIVNQFEGTPGGAGNGDYFDGDDLFIDDGAIFSLAGAANAQCGSDLRIKVAQITTCAGTDENPGPSGVGPSGGSTDAFDINFCVQVFEEGCQEDACISQECFVSTGFNPCTTTPLDAQLTVVDPIDCFGDLATVEVGGGGNGELTLELFNADDDTFISEVTGALFEAIPEGNYYLAMMDAFGCFDTTEVFSFVEPAELAVTTDFTQDILCFEENIGEICVDVVGGIDPISIELVDGAGTTHTINSGECFTDLPCGTANLTVSDGNGCTYTESFDLTCPAGLVPVLILNNSPCFESCEGSIEGNMTGGTGDVVMQWSGPDGPLLDVTGASPQDITITGLCEGLYTLTAEDANGCAFADSYELLDPDPLATTVTSTDINCFGECSGTISIEANGGTGDLSVDCDGIAGPNITDLCAGTYTCITTDENGCEITDEVTIIEPDLITYDLTITQLACSDACIGEIAISNIAGGGGSGNWTVTLSPVAGVAIDGLPTDYAFTELCAGTYDLSITDLDNNCTVTEEAIEIFAPAPLEVQLDPTNVSCFGLNDGSIAVTCIGGAPDVAITAPVSQPCPSDITDLAPGTYTVTIEDAQGCTAEGTVDIAEPTLLELSVTETTEIGCGGDCDATASYVYSGGIGSITLTLNAGAIPDLSPIEGLCAADYTLCAIDGNGCEACVDFTIDEPEPIEILIATEQVTCTGMCDGFANVFATGGQAPVQLTYEPEGLDLNNLCEGSIEVLAEDQAGCTSQATIEITAETVTDMELTLFSTPETCWETNDGTITAAVTGGIGEVTWLWNDPLLQTTETAIGLPSNESFTVIVTDSLGCTLDTTLVVDPNVGCFFVATALTPNGDGYNDEWLIGGLEYFPDALVQVYNRWGQLLFESRGYDVPWDGRSNGNPVPIADYYYIIKYDETEDPILGTVTVKY